MPVLYLFTMKRILLAAITTVITTLMLTQAGAQMPSTKNLSTLNIDALTDEQLTAYLQQAQLSGLTEEALAHPSIQPDLLLQDVPQWPDSHRP